MTKNGSGRFSGLSTALAAYRFVWANRFRVALLAAVWAPVTYAANELLDDPNEILGLKGLATLLIDLVGFSSMAIVWHRYILLGEAVSALANPLQQSWRYPLMLLFIALLVFAVAAPTVVFTSFYWNTDLEADDSWIDTAIFAVILLPPALLWLPLSLLLSAYAIQDKTMSWKRSVRMAGPFVGSLLVGYALTLPPTIAIDVLDIGDPHPIFLKVLSGLATVIVSAIDVALFATYFSYVYRALVGTAQDQVDVFD